MKITKSTIVLVIVIFVISVIFIILLSSYNGFKLEHFSIDTRSCGNEHPIHLCPHMKHFPEAKINLVPSKCMDDAPRYARFSNTGAIMYVSNKIPSDTPCCRQIKCPRPLTELDTLGNTNYCWKC